MWPVGALGFDLAVCSGRASEKQRINARSGSNIPSARTQCTCTTKLQVVCCLPVAYLTRHEHRPSGLRLVAEQARASKAE